MYEDEEKQIFGIKNKVFRSYGSNNTDNNSTIQNKLINFFKMLFILVIIILVLFFIFYIRNIIKKGTNSQNIDNLQQNFGQLYNLKTNNESEISNNQYLQNKLDNNTLNIADNNNNINKLGVAFVYSTLFSNGIARFITITSNYLVETGKYDVYVITGKPYSKEYKINDKIKRFVGHNNMTIIKNITKYYKIDYFILQNVLSKSTINWYKSLGAKILGMFHGNYMSAMFLNDPFIYKHWKQFDLLDAYIFITADDYYFYNKLNFKNHIFIPNLYTFEPSKLENSNLTYNNIMMLGRQNDKIKGAIYAVKAMDLIVKEVPDAKLNIITSDSRIEFLKNLTNELNLTDSVKIIYHTYDISKYFYNSSIHMFTSLSEAFPMAMNEGKAHGLPIVAFDVPISPPYQSGVITVESLNYAALAKECIKLLKDYDYRRKMGENAKLSLNRFSNYETVGMWDKLFTVLREGEDKFRLFQKEIEEKYYNEENARIHIEKHFKDMQRYNSNFSCYTLENFTNEYYASNIKACD